MKYTESQKQQLRDFVKEGLARVIVYMKTTHGLPEDITLEEINKLPTMRERMALLNGFYKENPKLFEGIPHYKP